MITAEGNAAQTAESPLTPWQFERPDVGAHDLQIEYSFDIEQFPTRSKRIF